MFTSALPTLRLWDSWEGRQAFSLVPCRLLSDTVATALAQDQATLTANLPRSHVHISVRLPGLPSFQPASQMRLMHARDLLQRAMYTPEVFEDRPATGFVPIAPRELVRHATAVWSRAWVPPPDRTLEFDEDDNPDPRHAGALDEFGTYWANVDEQELTPTSRFAGGKVLRLTGLTFGARSETEAVGGARSPPSHGQEEGKYELAVADIDGDAVARALPLIPPAAPAEVPHVASLAVLERALVRWIVAHAGWPALVLPKSELMRAFTGADLNAWYNLEQRLGLVSAAIVIPRAAAMGERRVPIWLRLSSTPRAYFMRDPVPYAQLAGPSGVGLEEWRDTRVPVHNLRPHSTEGGHAWLLWAALGLRVHWRALERLLTLQSPRSGIELTLHCVTHPEEADGIRSTNIPQVGGRWEVQPDQPFAEGGAGYGLLFLLLELYLFDNTSSFRPLPTWLADEAADLLNTFGSQPLQDIEATVAEVGEPGYRTPEQHERARDALWTTDGTWHLLWLSTLLESGDVAEGLTLPWVLPADVEDDTVFYVTPEQSVGSINMHGCTRTGMSSGAFGVELHSSSPDAGMAPVRADEARYSLSVVASRLGRLGINGADAVVEHSSKWSTHLLDSQGMCIPRRRPSVWTQDEPQRRLDPDSEYLVPRVAGGSTVLARRESYTFDAMKEIDILDDSEVNMLRHLQAHADKSISEVMMHAHPFAITADVKRKLTQQIEYATVESADKGDLLFLLGTEREEEKTLLEPLQIELGAGRAPLQTALGVLKYLRVPRRSLVFSGVRRPRTVLDDDGLLRVETDMPPEASYGSITRRSRLLAQAPWTGTVLSFASFDGGALLYDGSEQDVQAAGAWLRGPETQDAPRQDDVQQASCSDYSSTAAPRSTCLRRGLCQGYMLATGQSTCMDVGENLPPGDPVWDSIRPSSGPRIQLQPRPSTGRLQYLRLQNDLFDEEEEEDEGDL